MLRYKFLSEFNKFLNKNRRLVNTAVDVVLITLINKIDTVPNRVIKYPNVKHIEFIRPKI